MIPNPGSYVSLVAASGKGQERYNSDLEEESMGKEVQWERIDTNLETLPVAVGKQCFLDSLSELIKDEQMVIFLEYQRLSDSSGRIIGSTALVSVVEPEYFNEVMDLHSEMTGKKNFIDIRDRSWHEVKNYLRHKMFTDA